MHFPSIVSPFTPHRASRHGRHRANVAVPQRPNAYAGTCDCRSFGRYAHAKLTQGIDGIRGDDAFDDQENGEHAENANV